MAALLKLDFESFLPSSQKLAPCFNKVLRSVSYFKLDNSPTENKGPMALTLNTHLRALLSGCFSLWLSRWLPEQLRAEVQYVAHAISWCHTAQVHREKTQKDHLDASVNAGQVNRFP